MAERNARALMAQCPGALAQRAQTQSTSTPHMPQMVPPLRQPLPGWLAMPYQQAVQPPKKSTGRGVASDPSADKTAPGAVQVHRTTEDLPLEGREMVVDPSVTPEVCSGRRVHSHCIRRAICPPGQCQAFHHQRHLKEPSLSGEVHQGPPSAIPHDWWQNFAVVVGRRTWSMCSRSITNTTLPPLRRQNGRGSRRSFSNTSSHIRRKHWASKKDAQWTIWHTLKTIFIRPRAST